MATSVQAFPRPTLEISSIEEIRDAVARSEPIVMADPVLSRTEFLHRRTFYPLGFPLEISTNCEEILNLAEHLWGDFSKKFDTPPIQLEFGVVDGPACACPPPPTSHIRRHVCSVIADGENFAISDLAEEFSYAWTTRGALAYPSYIRYFLLESSALCHIAMRFTTPIHAACVTRDGCGILLCGDSGAGKSTLSYACAQAGWTYVTDDGSFLVNGREDGLVAGNCTQFRFRPSAGALFPELHGREAIQRAGIGKPSIEVAAAWTPGIDTSATAQARFVVFLNRRNGPRQELIPFPTDVARYSMLQRLCNMPGFREEQERMIDRLLEGGAFELCYTDLDWAVQRLARLAEEGR
jgi:hypothetical protein